MFPFLQLILSPLQLTSSHFVTFIIEFGPIAIEMVGFAIQFVDFKVVFIALALKFIMFAQNFVTVTLAAISSFLSQGDHFHHGEYQSNPKQPSCKKGCGPKNAVV